MIGIGKWEGKVNTMFIKGSAVFDIADDNGEYKIDISLGSNGENGTNLNISYSDIHSEGNTLFLSGEISMLPGKTVSAELTFDGNSVSGFLRLPIAGLKNIPITGTRLQ